MRRAFEYLGIIACLCGAAFGQTAFEAADVHSAC